MKTMTKKVVIIALFIVSLYFGGIKIDANTTVGINVSYSPSEEYLATFHMKVEINGEGEVLDKNIIVKDHTIYSLHYDDIKQFQLKAKNGYYLQSIYYDGKEITDLVSNNYIKISAKDYDTVLKINFAQKNDVETGDFTNRNLLLIMLLASLLIIYVFRKRTKEGR